MLNLTIKAERIMEHLLDRLRASEHAFAQQVAISSALEEMVDGMGNKIKTLEAEIEKYKQKELPLLPDAPAQKGQN